MATLADIAAALNLNKTTVSKALNDSSDISRATKQRVLEEAERVAIPSTSGKRLLSSGAIWWASFVRKL